MPVNIYKLILFIFYYLMRLLTHCLRKAYHLLSRYLWVYYRFCCQRSIRNWHPSRCLLCYYARSLGGSWRPISWRMSAGDIHSFFLLIIRPHFTVYSLIVLIYQLQLECLLNSGWRGNWTGRLPWLVAVNQVSGFASSCICLLWEAICLSEMIAHGNNRLCLSCHYYFVNSNYWA